MNDKLSEPKPVFSTPWFEVLELRSEGQPYYTIRTSDFAVIVAVDAQGQLLLVRQFRPAVAEHTLELPAGHIEVGETPEQAARKELLEETGYEAETFELLGCFSPSTARFTNRMWCFFAAGARPAANAQEFREAGVDLVLYGGSLGTLLQNPEFYAAGSCAALFAALMHGKIKPQSGSGC